MYITRGIVIMIYIVYTCSAAIMQFN